MPSSVATPNAAIIARFIAPGLTRPAATARSGPTRSGPSAPRSASNTSLAKLVPIWIASAPASAASAGPSAMPPAAAAHAVPTTTGTTAAGRVRSRAAAIQVESGDASVMAGSRSRIALEPREVGLALLEVGLLALAALVGGVVQQRRRAGELHHAGLAVAVGVHRQLEEAQRGRRHREHLAAPLQRGRLELGERDHGVDQAHVERLAGVVLPAQVPDLARLLLADDAREVRAAEPGVEAADPRAGLAEPRVVGGDRQIAHQVEDVAAADREAGDLRDDRLGQVADPHVEIEDVEPRHAVVADVAARAAHALVAARAERGVAGAGQD